MVKICEPVARATGIGYVGPPGLKCAAKPNMRNINTSGCVLNRTKSLPFNGILEADWYCVIVAMCLETKQFGRESLCGKRRCRR